MSGRSNVLRVVRFGLLCIFAAVMLFPMVWIVSGSLKPLEQVFLIPVKWIPDPDSVAQLSRGVDF